jgi:iron complex outermembrane receptor protein
MKFRLICVLFIFIFFSSNEILGQEKNTTRRVIAESGDQNYQVTIYLGDNGNEGFMRIMELFPENYQVKDIEAENAVVTLLSSGIKFLYTANQKRPEFIQYYLLDKNNSGKPVIQGDCIAGTENIETQYIIENSFSESIQTKKSVIQLSISGTISDSKTGEKLMGVIIKNESTGSGLVSNPDGQFVLPASVGDTLELTYLGYKTLRYGIQSKDLGAEVNLMLQSGTNEFNVVVVSAGKFEQNVSEVTMSMEVLTPQLLHDKNVVSADEALQQTPGVSIVDKEPQIRSGSGYSFGAGSRVQILVDDMPTLSGDAGRPAWDYLPIENVSQVEVIKGASSVLYGSAALSGVINLRTASPADTARTVITAYHGFYSTPQNERSVYWSGNLQRSGLSFLHLQKFGQLDVTLAANLVGDDGHLGPQRDSLGAFENKYNPFTADRYSANSRARLNTNLRYRSRKVVGLSFGLNANWNISNSLSTLVWENADTALYSAYAGSATRTKQLLGTVDPYITYFTPSGQKHSLRSRWQSLDNNNDNNQGNFSDQYYGEYQYQHDWKNAGIESFNTTVGLVGMYTQALGELFTGGNADGRNTAENYAAYLQLDKKLFERLNISAGVRYEYFKINETSDEKPVFRAGANYQLGKATYLRASYGQGFRFPSIAEKFIVTGVGSINIFANPSLIAETSDNKEIGIKQGFKIGNFLGYADVAVFEQNYENFIEFTFGQWSTVPVGTPFAQLADAFAKTIGFKSLNTGKARIRGAEFSIMGAGTIGKHEFQLLAGYTYTNPITLTPKFDYAAYDENSKLTAEKTYTNTSSDTTGNILKYRLQHLVRGDIFWKYKKLSAGVSARYNSHMQNIDKAFLDLEDAKEITNFNPGIITWREKHKKGDYVFDMRIGYEIMGRHRLSIIVNNVLNREYAIRPLAIEEPRMTMLQYTLTL